MTKKPHILIAVLFAALALLLLPSRAAPKSPIRQLQYKGSRFTVVSVDLRQYTLKMFWKNPKGQIFSSLSHLEQHLKNNKQRVVATMNAGIFDTSQAPLGLHVERGVVLHPLKTRRSGYGNFYLQPNGVFYLDKTGAHILETLSYQRQNPKALEATQSGPMLVQGGKIHAAFRPNSPNRLPRNAVGVSSQNTVHLVMSDDWVNFDDMARFMRDTLGCTDALYLDGSISALRIPQTRASDGEFAGMIGVLEK
jgi:uncharacterized protein YigE (DUF2233 family)